MGLGSTRLLREMSTKNLSGGKGLLEHKADNLSLIYESNVSNNDLQQGVRVTPGIREDVLHKSKRNTRTA
jgi:hypothetical protein